MKGVGNFVLTTEGVWLSYSLFDWDKQMKKKKKNKRGSEL